MSEHKAETTARSVVLQEAHPPTIEHTHTAIKFETPGGIVRVRHRDGMAPEGMTWGDLAASGHSNIVGAVQQLLGTLDGTLAMSMGLARLFHDVAASGNAALLDVLAENEIKVTLLAAETEPTPVACFTRGPDIEKGDMVELVDRELRHVRRIDPGNPTDAFGIAAHGAVAAEPVLVLTHEKDVVPC